MAFKHSNCIVVFNKDKSEVLFCKRAKEPFKGQYNFVGGKVEKDESPINAAYRELEEETGISAKDIKLYRMMDITYYHLNFVLELYVGTLQEEMELVEEVNPLEWLSIEENFADPDRFAGKQNIAHIINVAMEFEAPENKLATTGMYIGVDGCKGGWIASVYDRGSFEIKKYFSIEELVEANKNYNELLIDMVIGLQSNKYEVRPDNAARALIPGRTSTIFAVPARQAVYADTREQIREANKNALGKDLPAQAIAIIPKMRELDEFLQENPTHKNRLKESHPEVCFSRLNGSVVMSRKADGEGITERVGIIKQYMPEITEEYIYQEAKRFKCNADDIVDSIVLCITANLTAQGKTDVIPETVQEDVTGLKMQMTIPNIYIGDDIEILSNERI